LRQRLEPALFRLKAGLALLFAVLLITSTHFAAMAAPAACLAQQQQQDPPGHDYVLPNVRAAVPADALAVTELVNTAFLKDDFFKRPEFVLRMTPDGSEAMEVLLKGTEKASSLSREVFLVYEDPGSQNLLGCVKVELWVAHVDGERDRDVPESDATFGHLAVPDRNGGKGVGSALLKAVEAFVLREKRRERAALNASLDAATGVRAAAAGASPGGAEPSHEHDLSRRRDRTFLTVRLAMPLISVREDLFAFYGARNFAPVDGVPRPLPRAVEGMVAPDYADKVKFVWYAKTLDLGSEN